MDLLVENAVQLQRDIDILTRILRRLVDRDLVETDVSRALAGDVGVADRLHTEMAPGETVHIVRPLRLEHVGLQQCVVSNAGQRDAVVGEHVLIVLDVLADFFPGRILEPWFQSPEHVVDRQLREHTRVAVGQRDIRGSSRFERER